jgi:SpoVK/Ycf46/Vps4 family AAA+-type ATPase
MARTDLILNLARAGAQGDQLGVRRTLEAMVAEERGRQHHVVADRLAEFLAPSESGVNGASRLGPQEATGGLLIEAVPRRTLDDLVLPRLVKDVCAEVVEEQHRAELLRSHGLEPRHRVLFVGPPGNGKTSLAEALAGELSLPLLIVRYEAVVGSYLGETAVRLARLFDHVRARRCVLFFDEFDALGKERGDEHETGEIKRVVSALLLNIDALPSYVVVACATNHAELLDRAVWRRFQVRLSLPTPGRSEIVAWMKRFQGRMELDAGLATRAVADRLRGSSYAELEEFCADVQRRMVLAGPAADPRAIASTRLAQWGARKSVQG